MPRKSRIARAVSKANAAKALAAMSEMQKAALHAQASHQLNKEKQRLRNLAKKPARAVGKKKRKTRARVEALHGLLRSTQEAARNLLRPDMAVVKNGARIRGFPGDGEKTSCARVRATVDVTFDKGEQAMFVGFPSDTFTYLDPELALVSGKFTAAALRTVTNVLGVVFVKSAAIMSGEYATRWPALINLGTLNGQTDKTIAYYPGEEVSGAWTVTVSQVIPVTAEEGLDILELIRTGRMKRRPVSGCCRMVVPTTMNTGAIANFYEVPTGSQGPFGTITDPTTGPATVFTTKALRDRAIRDDMRIINGAEGNGGFVNRYTGPFGVNQPADGICLNFLGFNADDGSSYINRVSAFSSFAEFFRHALVLAGGPSANLGQRATEEAFLCRLRDAADVGAINQNGITEAECPPDTSDSVMCWLLTVNDTDGASFVASLTVAYGIEALTAESSGLPAEAVQPDPTGWPLALAASHTLPFCEGPNSFWSSVWDGLKSAGEFVWDEVAKPAAVGLVKDGIKDAARGLMSV